LNAESVASWLLTPESIVMENVMMAAKIIRESASMTMYSSDDWPLFFNFG